MRVTALLAAREHLHRLAREHFTAVELQHGVLLQVIDPMVAMDGIEPPT